MPRPGSVAGALGFIGVWCGLVGWAAPSQADELRGMWADAFQSGFKSTYQINTLVSRAVTGNYNAIFAEVMAYQDTGSGGHGAYWDSAIVPRASDVSVGIDPLATLIAAAHANGIEVHAWLVPFRVSTSWPPSGNSTLISHPEWFMVTRSGQGGGPQRLDGKYMLDPGSPDVQAYLMSIVRELVTDYEIDGIHWDYIRYTQTDAGYPADTSYIRSGLARFKAITGYSGTPATDYGPWNDFRRRELAEVVRRGLAEVHTIDANPRQPLRYTAALLATGNAPVDFSYSQAYSLFQDWRSWMDEGWLDAGCPMNYKREHCTDQAQWYRNWIDAALGWRYGRHMYCGQAPYLNGFSGSINQLAYVHNEGADGSMSYSYYATRSTETDCDGSDSWVSDASWYSYVASNLFTSPAAPPAMAWYDPATTTDGTIYGRVTDGATGEPIDNATIKINGWLVTETDGNGFYILTRRIAGVDGSLTPVSAVADGYAEVARPAVLVERAQFTEANFALGTWEPGDYDVDGDVDVDDFAEFSSCVTGPDNGSLNAGCDLFDFDSDADIDLLEFQTLQQAFTG